MLKYSHTDLDETDLAILDFIQRDGRVGSVELACQVNLSPPATHGRVPCLRSTQAIICHYHREEKP